MTLVEQDLDQEEFETNQTVLAAFLVYSGHDISGTEWADGMCRFFFERTPDLSADFARFCTGEALVEPVSFSNAFGQVTKRIKAERDKNNRPQSFGRPVHRR